MAELKTKKNDQNVEEFLNSVTDPKKRADSFEVLKLMKDVTKEEPCMWGNSIVGFGDYHYKYKSGREGDWFLIGFSPRKQYLTLYIVAGFDHYEDLLAKLGKYKTGKSCLYLKRLSDVNSDILKTLASESVKFVKNRAD
ncbi:hypothetical protein CEE45_13575 [Candidatus Heimdallarchaeota archaeon B3_Heim]|nr:MAG: hypothetical protein CEE45_13575 [Candidatus Heimdallarchaeota archaeon B3_Heim]